MKKIIFFAFIILNFSVLFSCSSDDNGTASANPFQGNWSGNLTGEAYSFNGTWSGTVASNGKFNGKVITTQSSPDHDLIITGQVNETGSFTGTMKNADYNINLECNGNFQNSIFNGTWVFNGADMNGDWNGTKN